MVTLNRHKDTEDASMNISLTYRQKLAKKTNFSIIAFFIDYRDCAN